MLSVIILLVSTLTAVISQTTLLLRSCLSQKGKTEKKRPLPTSPKGRRVNEKANPYLVSPRGRRSNKRILLIEN